MADRSFSGTRADIVALHGSPHTHMSRFPRFILLYACLSLLVVMTACFASGQSVDPVLDESRGEASYYADKFAGETTASGEIFDPREMTAAHPELPFGTKVRVTRVGGERERAVTVRINDRGPYADDRIIDLSEAAAEEIGMIEEGIVEVRIEVLELPSGEPVTSSRAEESSSEGGW
jgi:rare lipoprotein A